MATVTQRGANVSANPAHSYEYVARIRRSAAETVLGRHATLFVVRRPGTERLLVEKRMPLSDDGRLLHVNEIRIHSALQHYSLLEYVDGYIHLPAPTAPGPAPQGKAPAVPARPQAASLYAEYCPLGTLWELGQRVRQQRVAALTAAASAAASAAAAAGAAAPAPAPAPDDAAIARAGPRLPELFIWHVFATLLRALVVLRTGHGDAEKAGKAKVRGWAPLLHRDIKPDNIFLRARDARATAAHQRPPLPPPPSSGNAAGGRKAVNALAAATRRLAEAADTYPDVLLGDFGEAIESEDPGLGAQHTEPHGVRAWHGAEYPRHERHGKSDVYAVGAVIEYLCTTALPVPPDRPVSLPGYSATLQRAIRHARGINAQGRSMALPMFAYLEEQFKTEYRHVQVEALPDWALVASDPATWPADAAGAAAFQRPNGGDDVVESAVSTPHTTPPPSPKRPRDETDDEAEDPPERCQKCGSYTKVLVVFDDCFLTDLVVRNNRVMLEQEGDNPTAPAGT